MRASATSRALHKTGKNTGKSGKVSAGVDVGRRRRRRRARARIVVEKMQRGNVTYQRELVKCGKPKCSRCRRRPAHGPYWYGYWRSWSKGGRVVSKYIGKILPEHTDDGWS